MGFRNHSTDKFLLVVGDVRVQDSATNLSAAAPEFPFASEHACGQLGMAIVPTLAINAFNSGAMALTNVIGVATAKLDGSAGPGVAITAALASLAIGAIAPLTFDAPPPYSGPACGPRHTA